ncbi:MAG: cobalamin biosynthesis protein CobD [Lachnospiraceae bacterium]|nr:cobalamin biosynthesis protein CobD [Lachnospiraceae bacterium]
MKLVFTVIFAVVLDLLFGDPPGLMHPVVLMGKCISRMDRSLRTHFPEDPDGEYRAGRLMALTMVLGTFVLTGGILWIVGIISPVIAFLLNTFWCYQAIAIRDMLRESENVRNMLQHGGLESGRRAVARIVGRDTERLDEAGVIRAAVETVAENFSDGVVAPLFYMVIGGAPLALTYKAINTMDSMVGYKNERYLHFGHFAARLDDAANFLPARMAAFFLMAGAFIRQGKTSAAEAMRIWRRDRFNHSSPNSAQTEAVMAGALGVQLAGPAWYFGEKYDKPTIGDDLRPIRISDIDEANRMFFYASLVAAAVLCLIRLVIVF